MKNKKTPNEKLVASPKDIYHEKRKEFWEVSRKYEEVKYQKAIAELNYWIWLEEKKGGERK